MEKQSQNQKLSGTQIQRLLDKIDIENYLNKNKIEYREGGDAENPQFIVHTCPFCKNINYKGNDHPDRVYIGKNNRKFICYNCKTEGIFLKFIAKIERLSFKDIFDKYLGEGVFEALPERLSEILETLDEKRKIISPITQIEMPKEFEELFNRPQKKFRDVYQYMINRGLKYNKKHIYQALDIRYCDYLEYHTPSGKIHFINKRIIFPIYWGSEFIGFQGRDVTGRSSIKYYISGGLPKRRIIYNYNNIKDAETIIICEGIFDLMKCWSYNPICVFGSSLSNEQLTLLQNMPKLKNIIIGLDPDTKFVNKKGKSKYNKLIEQLKPFWNISEVNLPDGKDFGDCSFEEVDEIMKKLIPYKERGLTSELK